jgi:hypothetical protein
VPNNETNPNATYACMSFEAVWSEHDGYRLLG